MPVALNCWSVPTRIVGFAGVTAMLVRRRAATVSVVLPLTAPSVALIVDVPMATPWASPAALMVASAGVADAQVTDAVRSAVEASE